jgi:hypothetical protein
MQIKSANHSTVGSIEEMGRSFSTYEGDEKRIKIWSKNLKGRDHFGDLATDGRVMLNGR